MDTDSVLIEAAFMLGKHCKRSDLTPEAARMFSRIFDLTVRAAIANTPDQWESKEGGRTYALGTVAQIAEAAARLAGAGHDITAEIMHEAANRIIDEQRTRFGMPIPDPTGRVMSKFCFCYVASDLFERP